MCLQEVFYSHRAADVTARFHGGAVSLLPSPPAGLSSVNSWDCLKHFLKQLFLVSHRWALACVRLLKLGRNSEGWIWDKAFGAPKGVHFVFPQTHCGDQGQINQSLHSSNSLACLTAPIHPICFHMDPKRLMVGTGDAPGPFLQEHGCCLPASQATGMRLPTALQPGRARFQEVLASRQDLRRPVLCPEHPFVCLWTLYLFSSLAALSVYAIYTSTESFAPNKDTKEHTEVSAWWEKVEKTQHLPRQVRWLQKNYWQFYLVQDFLPFNFYMFSCWS